MTLVVLLDQIADDGARLPQDDVGVGILDGLAKSDTFEQSLALF